MKKVFRRQAWKARHRRAAHQERCERERFHGRNGVQNVLLRPSVGARRRRHDRVVSEIRSHQGQPMNHGRNCATLFSVPCLEILFDGSTAYRRVNSISVHTIPWRRSALSSRIDSIDQPVSPQGEGPEEMTFQHASVIAKAGSFQVH